MRPAITMMIRMDSLGDESFKKSFLLVDFGRYLVDANHDIWYLIDRDGIHLVYAKDGRTFDDISHGESEGN